MIDPKALEKKVHEQAVCVYNSDEIHHALVAMAEMINQQLADKNPVVLCAMKGALMTTAHLLVHLTIPLQVDYIHATRYQGQLQPGAFELISEPSLALTDRTVLIVEDILEGGVTLAKMKQYCLEQGATAVYTAALLTKQCSRHQGGIETVDFSGLNCEDVFLFGFGMDYQGYLRNMPGIYTIEEEFK